MIDYEGFLQLVQKRRSIRRFKPDPLPDDYVNKIVEAARFAPSGANSQPWEIVVVRDKATKDRIVEIVNEANASSYKLGQTRPKEERHPADDRPPGGRPGFADAPVFLILFGDPRLEATYPLSAYTMNRASITPSSLANVFLYMHLAAASLGLGSQWVTATSQPLPQALIKQLLGIPRDYTLYDTMVAGFPDQSPRPRLVRPAQEFTHAGRYDTSKYRSDDQVKKFIKAIHDGRATIAD
ncbi:MAG: nitroreductase family protein [Chloroflexi bacterium]|nr:nitroreductase family protein [Chloroflexota bacterium]